MSGISKIEWTDRTWNPIRGCSVVSPGCVNCYAMKFAHRFSGHGKPYEGLTKQTKAGPQWTGAIRLVHDALLEPLSWRKPARVFVNSMSDLFHENVPDDFIDRVFGVMACCPQHTFQILTKRPERMRAWATQGFDWQRIHEAAKAVLGFHDPRRRAVNHSDWPLPNVWLGVSVEDQQRADERIPLLIETPALVKFVSAEPLLGPIVFQRVPGFNRMSLSLFNWWVIVGGESGPNARGCNVAWIRSIVSQCRIAGVPVFVKQLGAVVIDRNDAGFMGDEPHHWPDRVDIEDRVEHDLNGTRDGYQGAPVRIHLDDRKGGDPAEWPEDLRVREFPRSEVSA